MTVQFLPVRNLVKVRPEFVSYKLRLLGQNQSLMFSIFCTWLPAVLLKLDENGEKHP